MYLYTLLTIVAALSVSIQAAPTGPPPLPKAGSTQSATLVKVNGSSNTASLNSNNNLSATQSQNAAANVFATNLSSNTLVSASGTDASGKASTASKNTGKAAVNVYSGGGNTAKTSNPPASATTGTITAAKISGDYNNVGSTSTNNANQSNSQSKGAQVGVDTVAIGSVFASSAGGSANKNAASTTVNIGENGSNNLSTSGKKSSTPGNTGVTAIKTSGNSNRVYSNTNNNSHVANAQALTNTVGVGSVQANTVVNADGGRANSNAATNSFNVGNSNSNTATSAKHR